MEEVTERETQQLWIGIDMHRQLKIEAAKRGVTMRTLVEEAIREYLAREEEE